MEVVINGTQGVIGDTNSWYDESNGAYNFAADSDHTYKAYVDDTGIALAKDWPAGEPTGIKVINNDLNVKAPKPARRINLKLTRPTPIYPGDPSPQVCFTKSV